jgi:hypothetical protein
LYDLHDNLQVLRRRQAKGPTPWAASTASSASTTSKVCLNRSYSDLTNIFQGKKRKGPITPAMVDSELDESDGEIFDEDVPMEDAPSVCVCPPHDFLLSTCPALQASSKKTSGGKAPKAPLVLVFLLCFTRLAD